jgi:serine/threonine protein kinase
LQVWLKDDHVWEVHPFYEGISLLELVRRNKYPIQGELLGRIFNVLIHATSQIHELGILHRDINPSNIFITGPEFLEDGDEGSARFLILDCSFCCRMDSTQVPVRTSTYTAPEQMQGAATQLSDWYSIAATVFFLANGFPPERGVEERFKKGLQNIFAGSLRPPFSFAPHTEGVLGIQKSVPKLIETLLEPESSNRPQNNWEILLEDSTKVSEFYEVLGILDMGSLGWLVTQEDDFRVLSNDNINDFLNEAFSHNAIRIPSVVADAKRLLET